MATVAEYRAKARRAAEQGYAVRAEFYNAEADRLEAEQAQAARSTAVSSGAARGAAPTAPPADAPPSTGMPQTFMRPPPSTYVPEPRPRPVPEPDDSFDDLLGAPPPPPVSPTIAAPEPDPLDQVLPAQETLIQPGYAEGSQQVFVRDLPGTPSDFGGLLEDAIPSQPASMLGLDARTDIVEQYGRTQDALEDFYQRKYRDLAINKGVAPAEAARQAEEAVDRFRRIRVDPEGRTTTGGEGGLLDIPPFRESRIYQRRVEDAEGNPVLTPGGYPTYAPMYREPDGTFRKPTDFELVVESFARQRVLSPEQVEQHRAARAASLQKMLYAAEEQGSMLLTADEYERMEDAILETGTPYLEGYLTSLDPESGQVLETAAGAGLRGGAGGGVSLLNTALMEFTPLYWDQDPETGEPLDPDSLAYRMHELSRSALEMAGYTPVEVDRLTKGPIGLGSDGELTAATGTGAMGLLSLLPKPFQPVQRFDPTPVDPTGRRAVPEEASFLARFAAANATGRSLGDEFMSMPGMRGDAVPMLSPGMGVLAEQDMVMFANNANTVPYWVGMGMELPYPTFPVYSGLKAVGKGATAGAQAGAQAARGAAGRLRFLYPDDILLDAPLKAVERAADVTEKAAYVAGAPVEAARRSRAIRAAQEITEGRVPGADGLDIMHDLQSVRRVTGEATAAEVLAPYQVQAMLDANAISPRPLPLYKLVNVVGDSPAGRYVLQEAGVLGRKLSHMLTPPEVEALQRAVAEMNASSYRTAVTRIAQGEGDAAYRAKLILAQLNGAGINTKYLPGGSELRRIAAGTSDADPVTVLDEVFGRGLNRIQLTPARPVVTSIHELGSQIVRQAQSDEVRRLSGEMGRIMSRRMDGQSITRSTIAERPEEVFAAARAAAGRAVEARIQDVVPEDLVFVSRTLMVPRAMHTEQVVEEVARRVEKFQPQVLAGPKVDGVAQDVFEYPREVADELIRGFGADNVAQSRVLSDIVSNVRQGRALIADQRMLVEDMLKTRAYEQVLGPAAIEAAGFPASAARQFDLARQPGVNVGMETAREAEVARAPLYTYGRTSPMMTNLGIVLSEGGGRQIASTVRRVAKALGKDLDGRIKTTQEVAPGFQEMLRTLEGEFGSIGDAFLKEVRDTGIDLVAQGRSPEEAFNVVINRRLQREMADMSTVMRRRADELQESLNMTPEQAYYAIAYQRGRVLGEAGLGGAPIPDDIVQVAQQREQVAIVKQAWESVLENFFGRDMYDRYLSNPAVREVFIRQPGIQRLGVPIESVSDMRPLTIKGLRDVIADVREDINELQDIGASFGARSGSPDALIPALSAWAVGADAAYATRRAAREMRELNPQVYADLVPTLYSQTPKRLFREASLPLSGRRNVVRSLIKLGAGRDVNDKIAALSALEQSPQYKEMLRRAVNEDGKFYVDRRMTYAMEDQGQFVRELDALSEKLAMRLDPDAKLELAEAVLTDMLVTGSAVPNTTDMLRNMERVTNLDLTSLQKDAMYGYLTAIMRGMDELAASGWTSTSIGDAMLYEGIQAARRAGYSDEFILQNMRQTLVETAFRTYVSPIVDEINANMRATGFTPRVGEGSLTRMVQAAKSIDPYDDSIMVLGPELVEAVENLRQASRTGALMENLETLRRRDQLVRGMRGEKFQYGKYAGGLLLDALSLTRRTAASGLLAAGPVPIPNSRYIGMNAATASAIAVTTVGASNALRAYSTTTGLRSQARDVARQLSMLAGRPLVDAVSPRPLTDIVYTTETGMKMTFGELRRAVDRNNIGSSRGQVEFTESFLREVVRASQMMADGAPTSSLRRFLRNFDPTQTNQLQYFANATDIALRENVFATALQRGLTEAQAAELARNVVLDYGAVPTGIRNTLNKYMLFLAFRMANYTATLNALARDPGTFRKLVRLQQVNQNRTDAWAYGPDYMKARPLLSKEYVFDTDAGAAAFGPAIPPIDAMVDGMRMASFVANLGAEENQALVRAFDAAKEENLQPFLTYALEAYELGSEPMGQGRRVPTDVVEFAIQVGPDTFWPYLKERFNIRAVSPDDRIRGRPSAIDPQDPGAGPQEYRFESAEDQAAFKAWMLLLLELGLQRGIIDGTNTVMRLSPSEYLQVKRQGISPAIMFSTGLSTDLSLRSPEDLSIRALRETERSARRAEPQE